MTHTHAAWLPTDSFKTIGSLRIAVVTETVTSPITSTLLGELRTAALAHGGSAITTTVVPSQGTADLVFSINPDLPAESFQFSSLEGVVHARGGSESALLYAMFELLRNEDLSSLPEHVQSPDRAIRMLNHWDNMEVHPTMGQVERGYSGGSIFYEEGQVREDLTRVGQYARLLAATGINHVAINNVNVHEQEAHLLTRDLDQVARVASEFRNYGITTHLSVSFASPIILGGLATSDPLDPLVAEWWKTTTENVYRVIPDFGGFLVKADSEGQPGPFAYGRDHADGANMLAAALKPFGGIVHWRAFVYNHKQDWRDRKTDRARAAYDHFAPLDGKFADNVVVQIKNGPMDFQPREPISPVFAALPNTRVSLELQVTQEYTGQQKHACYLGPMWSQILGFEFSPGTGKPLSQLVEGVTAVSNVGMSEFWTGHPLAQANLYAFGRLTWQGDLTANGLLDEWLRLTFPGAPKIVEDNLSAILAPSWQMYENYTAPLGIGFMVKPGHHYGPDVDGYEYSPWGTYHFADRDGIGVDRTVATGTGYAGQYTPAWSQTYEDLATCPDELLLFFHHVPYTHVLHSGKTVIQHIYDTHFDGAQAAAEAAETWQELAGLLPARFFAEGSARFSEQVRSALDWRDQICSYFLRKSGIADQHGRTIY